MIPEVNGLRLVWSDAPIELMLERAYALHQPSYSPTPLDDFMCEEHREFSERVFRDALDMDVVRWQIHVNVYTNHNILSPDGVWIRHFPHVHDWPGSVTMVQFLSEPEAGGEFVLLPKGGEPIVVKPEPGLCVCCTGDMWHGVYAVKGSRDRVAAVVTGWE